MSTLKTQVNPRPLTYDVPPFPSLYWPVPVYGPQAVYLYDAYSIWRFTLIWSMIIVVGVHMIAASYAMLIQYHNWKVIWITPMIFCFVGALEACIAGNIVGGILGGIYTAGYFHMSTWIPLTWAIVNALVLILASFAIQGGL